MYILVLCPDLAIVNGQVNATTPPVALGYYSIGTSVSFACVNSAFKMDGSNFSTCDIDGSWNSPPPVCRQGNIRNGISYIYMSVNLTQRPILKLNPLSVICRLHTFTCSIIKNRIFLDTPGEKLKSSKF